MLHSVGVQVPPGAPTSMYLFDNLAEVFPAHARQHIPNYDTVIKKTLDICSEYPTDAAIVDVGCAVGETLIQLHHKGFTNLYGVDENKNMLHRCPKNLGITYIHDDCFNIDKTFDVVIVNWTLHFIENKIRYLKKIKHRLNPNGCLIVSDKTSKDSYPLQFYHELKRKNGVSDSQIIEKQQTVDQIMNINSPEWYFDTFNILGFQNCYIFDADWCFTSFVCKGVR